MKIIADENISFAREAFSGLGELKLVSGRSVSSRILKEADVLIVRSVTKVNEKLLNKTNVKFVGTATTGTDHIDTEYLSEKGIYFAAASGCNSDAVAEYVTSALIRFSVLNNFSLKEKVLGVIGVGNIGSRVARIGRALGMKVILNDPPLYRQTGDEIYRPLNELFDADVITFHVPLNYQGTDRTFHLFDRNELLRLKEGTVLINTSRGEVVNNTSLLQLLDKKKFNVILDVWENEPAINQKLLEEVFIGTPHIAGYSVEGKVNGTLMVYRALCDFIGIKPTWKPALPEVEENFIIPGEYTSVEKVLDEIISRVYDIKKDDLDLRKILSENNTGVVEHFDKLRKNYPYRREFSNYEIYTGSNIQLEEILGSLRFKINNSVRE